MLVELCDLALTDQGRGIGFSMPFIKCHHFDRTGFFSKVLILTSITAGMDRGYIECFESADRTKHVPSHTAMEAIAVIKSNSGNSMNVEQVKEAGHRAKRAITVAMTDDCIHLDRTITND